MCSAQEWGIFFCAGRKNVAACAGMGYPFRRRKEKCSRLCGKMVFNPRGMPGGNVLRGKWGSFMDGSAVDGAG